MEAQNREVVCIMFFCKKRGEVGVEPVSAGEVKSVVPVIRRGGNILEPEAKLHDPRDIGNYPSRFGPDQFNSWRKKAYGQIHVHVKRRTNGRGNAHDGPNAFFISTYENSQKREKSVNIFSKRISTKIENFVPEKDEEWNCVQASFSVIRWTEIFEKTEQSFISF